MFFERKELDLMIGADLSKLDKNIKQAKLLAFQSNEKYEINCIYEVLYVDGTDDVIEIGLGVIKHAC